MFWKHYRSMSNSNSNPYSKTDLSTIRRDYGQLSLADDAIQKASGDPVLLFKQWLADALQANLLDATAFVLATVDENHQPDGRVLLLKDVIDGRFLFFSHYNSLKGQQIRFCNKVSMNFYWREFARQVRIKGEVRRANREIAESYFAERPLESRVSTICSEQSTVIASRANLELSYQETMQKVKANPDLLRCPADWGGYWVAPTEIEFFQGRDQRMHDRLLCTRQMQLWLVERLSP